MHLKNLLCAVFVYAFCSSMAFAQVNEIRQIELKVIKAEAKGGGVNTPEAVVDGNTNTELVFPWGNGGVQLTVELDEAIEVEEVQVNCGLTDRIVWLTEIWIGPDVEHLRPLMGRSINLSIWSPAALTKIPVVPAVGRVMRFDFAGGGETGRIAEVAVFGRPNQPERHLMCWASDIQNDYLNKLDYIQNDLKATDLWLDSVETAFPQSTPNGGFDIWVNSGLLGQLQERGINYWLSEHESFCSLVNDPADLRDERKWQTTLREARRIYAKAKQLGFRGLVMDAEDYTGVSEAAKLAYADFADSVDGWCFKEEFGYAGEYYKRGNEFGKVIKEVWGCPVMQVYEARIYAGKNDCRAGNYWWLKGIADAGNEIWLATEKTYGAGQGEIKEGAPEHLTNWFVNTAKHVADVFDNYPFATRVLPGFHPWNTRTKAPNYLPQYLAQQLEQAKNCTHGCWIYNEGNARAGDPRDVLDVAILGKYDLTAEDYLEVLRN